MSYFSIDPQTKGDTQTATAVDPANPVDYVAKVVAAKGAQWSDPQELAKGYDASQAYIQNLENQAKEMQTELEKQDYAKTLLEQLQSQGKPPVTEQTVAPDSTTQENTTPQRSEDELKNLMKEVLTQTNTENVKSSNLQRVDEKLKELYGTEAEAKMAKKSQELGLSKERLQDLAGESPEAFFQIIGEKVEKEFNKTTQGTINTSAPAFENTSNVRNWDYYENLRRTNKALYFSAAVQKQLFADKVEQGSTFGN